MDSGFPTRGIVETRFSLQTKKMSWFQRNEMETNCTNSSRMWPDCSEECHHESQFPRFSNAGHHPARLWLRLQHKAERTKSNSISFSDLNFILFAIAGITRSLALFIPLLLLSAVPVSRAQKPPPASDQKVDKEFYTPKDRVVAIQAASIFAPKAVGDANIMQGPAQDPKQFQFHPNDKVLVQDHESRRCGWSGSGADGANGRRIRQSQVWL